MNLEGGTNIQSITPSKVNAKIEIFTEFSKSTQKEAFNSMWHKYRVCICVGRGAGMASKK